MLKRQAKEIEELRRKLGNAGCVPGAASAAPCLETILDHLVSWVPRHQHACSSSGLQSCCAARDPVRIRQLLVLCHWRLAVRGLVSLLSAKGRDECERLFPMLPRRNADVEAEIGQLRAQLLHKDQENERVQLQLQEEKEERERAQRKARPSSHGDLVILACMASS